MYYIKQPKKFIKKILWILIFAFVIVNIVAIFQAYKFTHFADSHIEKTQNPEEFSASEKIEALLFGISNPRPINIKTPSQRFETIVLSSNKKIECWDIQTEHAKGTVIMFHGYGGEKSSLLDKSDEFIKQGYSTFLVDFMGSGGSEGNQTTIGFKEAEEVKTAFDYIGKTGEKNICLFGTSMGAAAVLKAMHDYHLQPKSIILECPFGSLYQTTCARFRIMKIPVFPMAGMLDFWGGVENGFWAFEHQPTEYAKSVKCPALLLYGEEDNKVSRKEIDAIYSNLSGKKQLKTYLHAGHEDYLKQYKTQWIQDIRAFMIKT